MSILQAKYKTNDYRACVELYENNVNNAYSVEDLNVVACSYASLNRPDCAAGVFKIIRRKNPKHLGAIINLGNIEFGKRNYPQACDFYCMALGSTPSLLSYYENYLISCTESGKFDVFDRVFAVAVKIHEELNVFIVLLARNKTKSKGTLAGIKYLQPLINDPPRARDKDLVLELCKLYRVAGFHTKARELLEEHLEACPNRDLANYLSIIYIDLALPAEARQVLLSVIEAGDPDDHIYWNLASCAVSTDELADFYKSALHLNRSNRKTIISAAGLKMLRTGDQREFNLLTEKHPGDIYIQAYDWVAQLNSKPRILQNRWEVYDYCISMLNREAPFYEFGVWTGLSFKYLARKICYGYGFDTFTGLPEEWNNEPIGSYSAYGAFPDVSNGTFIKGKFEETLDNFFSVPRPIGSLINFDADLYSSTLHALRAAKAVIGPDTILIFDEFIMVHDWQKHEYFALTNFCIENDLDFEVICVSFHSKQVAVRLLNKY